MWLENWSKRGDLLGISKNGGWRDDHNQKKYHIRQNESPKSKQPSFMEKVSPKKTIEVVSIINEKEDSSNEEEEKQKGNNNISRGRHLMQIFLKASRSHQGSFILFYHVTNWRQTYKNPHSTMYEQGLMVTILGCRQGPRIRPHNKCWRRRHIEHVNSIPIKSPLK